MKRLIPLLFVAAVALTPAVAGADHTKPEDIQVGADGKGHIDLKLDCHGANEVDCRSKEMKHLVPACWRSDDFICTIKTETTVTTIPEATTTTLPSVPTTVPVSVATPTPAATPNVGAPSTPSEYTGCDIGTHTHCPGQPHGGPAELPRTGSTLLLALAGVGLASAGIAFRLLARR